MHHNSYFQYGGKQSPAERTERLRNDKNLNLWRGALSRAAAMKQEKKAEAGGPTRWDSRTQSERYKVTRKQVRELAQQLYAKENPNYTPGARQSSDARTRRVHGMSRRELHRPVTRSEAARLLLEAYKNEADRGHQVNLSGKRRYPTKGPIYDRLVKAGRGDEAGQLIPQRTAHKFENARQALRSRMSRSADARPDENGLVNGRRVVAACDDKLANSRGVITEEAARDAGCLDSWKLRRRGSAWNYQVPEVSWFPGASEKELASTELWRMAGEKLQNSPNRKKVNPTWLEPFRARRGQSREDRNRRVAPLLEANRQKRAAKEAAKKAAKRSPSRGRSNQVETRPQVSQQGRAQRSQMMDALSGASDYY